MPSTQTRLTWYDQKVTILASEHDIASVLIAEHVEMKGLPVFYIKNQNFLTIKDTDVPSSDNYIILSRHSSAAKEPAFHRFFVPRFSSPLQETLKEFRAQKDQC